MGEGEIPDQADFTAGLEKGPDLMNSTFIDSRENLRASGEDVVDLVTSPITTEDTTSKAVTPNREKNYQGTTGKSCRK